MIGIEEKSKQCTLSQNVCKIVRMSRATSRWSGRGCNFYGVYFLDDLMTFAAVDNFCPVMISKTSPFPFVLGSPYLLESNMKTMAIVTAQKSGELAQLKILSLSSLTFTRTSNSPLSNPRPILRTVDARAQNGLTT
jgi:hypothetical protein